MSDVQVTITAPPKIARTGFDPLCVRGVKESKLYLELTLFDVQENDVRELERSIGRAVLKAGGAL